MGLAGMDTPHEASPFEPYLRAWEARWHEERQAAVRAAEEARALAGRLAWLLVEKYGARRVVLVGSLARGEFGAGSDIDLAAEGIPDDSFFRAGADLEAAAGGLHVTWRGMGSSFMASGAAEPRERFVRLAASLRRHIEQIAHVVIEAREALERFGDRVPPSLEVRGIGAVVHDFYTGIEHLFEAVAPELNGGVPAGPAWHRELLSNMALDLPGIRPAVLARESAQALEEFLRFRHLFRNVYGFELEWPRLRRLLEKLPEVWRAVEADLGRFLGFLDAAGGAQPSRGR
jgi:hypothetical protein